MRPCKDPYCDDQTIGDLQYCLLHHLRDVQNVLDAKDIEIARLREAMAATKKEMLAFKEEGEKLYAQVRRSLAIFEEDS